MEATTPNIVGLDKLRASESCESSQWVMRVIM